MKTSTLALHLASAVGLTLCGLACGGNAPPSSAATPQTKTAPLQPHQQAVRNVAPVQQKTQTVAQQQNVTQPTIPAGARYTIFCTTFSGASHVAEAQSVRQKLLGTGLRDWHLLQGEKQTTLYYGYYRTVSGEDPKEARERQRAHNDLRAVSSLTDPGTGQKYFRSCWLAPLDELDPTGPAEWDLRRAPGYWSLQVMAFRDDPRRKEYAVEAAKELRREGTPAYYFHGPSMSSVCLGAFPVEAVKVTKQEYRSTNANDVVVVAPESFPLPEGRNVTNAGENVDIVKPKVEVMNPDLLALMHKYPNHADNGVIGQRKRVQGQWKEVYQPSFLVVVPGNDAAASRRSTQAAEPSDRADPFRALQRPGAPQGGKLRGIAD